MSLSDRGSERKEQVFRPNSETLPEKPQEINTLSV